MSSDTETEENVIVIIQFDSDEVIICMICKNSKADCVKCKQCFKPVCVRCKIKCSICGKESCHNCSFSKDMCTLCLWDFVI
jgi:hypothetical protein